VLECHERWNNTARKITNKHFFTRVVNTQVSSGGGANQSCNGEEITGRTAKKRFQELSSILQERQHQTDQKKGTVKAHKDSRGRPKLKDRSPKKKEDRGVFFLCCFHLRGQGRQLKVGRPWPKVWGP